MAFIEKTAFEPRMWNNRNNDLQNIPGRFQSGSADADCSAGFACNKGAHQAGGGYIMTQAADGKSDVYFCNPGDVQRGIAIPPKETFHELYESIFAQEAEKK